MITTAIYNILSSDAGLTVLVGDKIYPQRAPQGISMPFVVYMIDNTTPESTKDCLSAVDTSDVKFITFANDFDLNVNIATNVRRVLDGYKGTSDNTTFDRITFQSNQHGYDNNADVFVVESNFKLREIL